MYQSITIVGNVGKDAEMKYTPSGQAVTSFSVATNRQYKGKNEEDVKETTWFRVEAWGKQAEICHTYVKKGMKILVEGRLKSDKATGGPHVWNKQDGTSGASFEIVSNVVRFLSSKEGASDEHAPVAGEAQPIDEDSIPF
ncbi:MAG: single-stranded DNA-binding protein [Candidatus Obscuribacterales bacterium]|jgi:single-strand DNA-binding protein